jgi:CheY-like chemotaxis protein
LKNPVVGDITANRDLVRTILEPADLEVDEAITGLAALRLLAIMEV